MLSFYPGPSKVHPKALEFTQVAFQKGIVSINHRSNSFENLYQDTQDILHQKWNIPTDYTIYFISSASEAWEIVAQSVVIHKACHFFNGAFGQKWAQYNATWNPHSTSLKFSPQENLFVELQKSSEIYSDADTLCLVQSETSNGTALNFKRSDFNLNPKAIIAVDATSSMGGIQLPWQEADIWFASVQKCIGLPAGMGILICSPAALEQAKRKGQKSKYNDLLFMEENRRKNQTHFTPNVLSIFLLNQLTHLLPNLSEIEQFTLKKLSILEDFIKQSSNKSFDFLIENPSLRLPTVLAIKGQESAINNLLRQAENNHLVLGKGYGEWKNNSFRIANFPSHSIEDIHQLINFLKSNGL